MVKLPKEILAALDATGLPWSVEQGAKHYKVKVDGQLACIWPRGHKPQTACRRGTLNMVSQTRRIARGA